jgi:hypothetical protein
VKKPAERNVLIHSSSLRSEVELSCSVHIRAITSGRSPGVILPARDALYSDRAGCPLTLARTSLYTLKPAEDIGRTLAPVALRPPIVVSPYLNFRVPPHGTLSVQPRDCSPPRQG